MSAREELLKENEESIRECEARIAALMLSLGRKGVENASSLSLSIGQRLLSECYDRIAERRKAEERLSSIRSTSAEHEGRRESLAEKDRERGRLDERLATLESQLGAIIYERCTFSLLDKSRYERVYHDIEKDGKKNGGLLRNVGQRRRFARYARIAESDDSATGLDGSATRTLSEIREIKEELARLDGERKSLSAIIASKRHSYRAMSHGGIERAEKALAECVRRENEAMEGYGSQLYDKGALWIGDDTPSSMLSDLQSILNEKRLLDRLLSERARLGREAKADDLRALLESEEGKLRILRRERERIDGEIAEIEREAERLRGNIEKLQGLSERGGRGEADTLPAQGMDE